MSGKPGEDIVGEDLAEAFERLEVVLTGLRGADASIGLLDEAADVLAGLKADVAALELRAITAEAACEEGPDWGGGLDLGSGVCRSRLRLSEAGAAPASDARSGGYRGGVGERSVAVSGAGVMVDTLKPCPFCGGEAHTQERGTEDGERMVFCCACATCGASVEGLWWMEQDCPPGFEREDQAIEAWNKRTADNAVRGH